MCDGIPPNSDVDGQLDRNISRHTSYKITNYSIRICSNLLAFPKRIEIVQYFVYIEEFLNAHTEVIEAIEFLESVPYCFIQKAISLITIFR